MWGRMIRAEGRAGPQGESGFVMLEDSEVAV
jgi:hypothetical protein